MNATQFYGYDIVGDIHGCGNTLERLLQNLGYIETENGYRFADVKKPRQMIFLGDLIDRGPNILRTLALVKTMCDNGSAQVVMGNHEFNAIAYHTPYQGDYLRPRTERSLRQIAETLEQFKGNEHILQEYLEWFAGLPLFLELEQFRVVHACWDNHLIAKYLSAFNHNCLPANWMDHLFSHDALSLRLIDRLTKGLNLPFPEGKFIQSRDGFQRRTFRVDFWTDNVEIYEDIVFQPDPLPDEHRTMPVSEVDRASLVYYAPTEKPLFIGHYWLSGEPALVRSNIACLDYSAVNKGRLVAYRFNKDDDTLSDNNFVYVDYEG